MYRSCCCVGYLTNPGGRCCMDLPRGQTYVTDKIVITPNDDPSTPQPSPMAGSWQCQGCGRIYNMTVNHCDCQKRNMVTSGSTTTGVVIR